MIIDSYFSYYFLQMQPFRCHINHPLIERSDKNTFLKFYLLFTEFITSCNKSTYGSNSFVFRESDNNHSSNQMKSALVLTSLFTLIK